MMCCSVFVWVFCDLCVVLFVLEDLNVREGRVRRVLYNTEGNEAPLSYCRNVSNCQYPRELKWEKCPSKNALKDEE